MFHTAIEFSQFISNTDFYIDNEFEEIFDFNSANYDNIRNKLNNINWQSILRSKDDVNNSTEVFYNCLFKIILEEAP